MKKRIYFLDNLRTFLIFLVVVLHAGIVYEPILENTWIVSDTSKNSSIGLLRMYLDIFVMFTIFFISGYFIPRSIQSKSSLEFVVSKLKRIFLPWLIAVFTLIPAYKFIFLYARGLPQESWHTYFHFFHRPGTDLSIFSNNPTQSWLWFLPVLFLFQLLYLGFTKVGFWPQKISVNQAFGLTFVIGFAYSLTISLMGLSGWAHTLLFDFQRERLLVYFLAFLLGAVYYHQGVFESEEKNKKNFIIANVVLSIGLGIFTAVALNLFFNIIQPGRNYFFISEPVDKGLYYSSLIVSQLSFLSVLIYTFRYSWNKADGLIQELNRNSYNVYIIHVIVIGILALPLTQTSIPVLVKYLLLTLLTFAISNIIVSSYRSIKQKTFEMKTIVTTVIVILLVGVVLFNYRSTTDKGNSQLTQHAPVISLHEAAITGNLEVVNQHIKAGSNLDEREPSGGSSPLISAALFGQTEIAKTLIEAGAEVNLKNNDGSTALHTAAFFCHIDFVKMLLANGIDKNIKNNAGSTALESVTPPFEAVKGIYDYFQESLGPLGLKLDYEHIQNTRLEIVKLLQGG